MTTGKKTNLIKWYGGKFNLLNHVLPMPKHVTYIELFGGGGTVLLNKAPSRMEIYNDMNHDLVNFWRVFRDYYYFLKFAGFCMYNSRELFFGMLDGNETITEPPRVVKYLFDGMTRDGLLPPGAGNDIMDAARFFFLNRLSFSGDMTTFHGIEINKSNMYQSFQFFEKTGFNDVLETLSRLVESGNVKKAINTADAVHRRVKNVRFSCRDYKDFFPACDRRGVLLYVDPPYVKGGNKYKRITSGFVPWTDDDYIKLAALLEGLERARFILSIDDISFFDGKNLFIEEVENVASSSRMPGKKRRYKEYVVRNFDPDRVPKMSKNTNLENFKKGKGVH